jgi:hypothetical protein
MTFFSPGERETRPHDLDVGESYSTHAVETRPDGWTAEISRKERSQTTGAVEVISALVEVGSISHLIAATRQRDKEVAA